jgi:hypothetical protein
LTDQGPTWLALWIVLAGIVAALVAIGAGVVRLVVRSRAFKKRLDEVAKLPFLPTLELTSARLDIASRRLDSLPSLEARARRAIADLQAARSTIDNAAIAARDAIRFAILGP